MATDHTTIQTWFRGAWQPGNVPVLGSADHATWLGTLVFDGARRLAGAAPDLAAHLARVNRSATSMGMQPSMSLPAMMALVREGFERFDASDALYIRPMYWSTGHGPGFIAADPASTGFCLCLQSIPMPASDAGARLTTTHFRRPTLETAVVDAKAACLYPNNARMIREAIDKGFTNALVTDLLGNVAETATSNVFMVRDGEVFTPVPNGTFLNGITRQRTIALLRADGVPVHETTLTLQDFHAASEVFMSGNLAKITPVTDLDHTHFGIGPVSQQVRALYMDWSRSEGSDIAILPGAILPGATLPGAAIPGVDALSAENDARR